MAVLTDLPPEVVTSILGSVAPDDLVSVGLVCRWLRDCVRNNAQLGRLVYYNTFDPPPVKTLAWEREIWDFLRLKSICASDNPNKTSELEFVCRTVKRLLQHSGRITPADSDTLFAHRPFRNIGELSTMLNRLSNHAAFLCRSHLFDRVRRAQVQAKTQAHVGGADDGDGDGDNGDNGHGHGHGHGDDDGDTTSGVVPFPDAPQTRHQLSAELHCLLGTVLLTYTEEARSGGGSAPVSAPVPTYPYAASRVYDMRQHTAASGWGPFMGDGSGRVDWEKLEAVLIVLRHNIRSKRLLRFPILNKYWNSMFLGSWPDSYIPMRVRDASPLPDETRRLDCEDPYGVTGTWMRLVCFLDYQEFFEFNFPEDDNLPPNHPRPPLDADEELRFIIMKVHVTKIDPPGADDHADWPVVHFEGTAQSMDNPWDDNANSTMRGTVRTTRHGAVHWTTFSIYDGQPRWRSEGVQIGGRRSGRGVFGHWFDANYDVQGPCGPTAFWKLHERKMSETTTGGPIETFSYLLANSITNGINIVINVNRQFAQFGTLYDDENDVEENDSDYDDGGENVGAGNHHHHHYHLHHYHHLHHHHGHEHDDDDDDDDDEHEHDQDGGGAAVNHGGMTSNAIATVILPNFPPFEILPILDDAPETADHNHAQPTASDEPAPPDEPSHEA